MGEQESTMDIKLTNNTTENNEAVVALDEKAVVSIIQELVSAGSKPQEFAGAMEAFTKNVERAMNACNHASAPVPPTQPIAEADVPADIRAKAEEVTTKKEEGIDMEEVIKRAKEEAEVEMSTRMIMFEIGRMPKGELVERAQHWMDAKDPVKIERQTTIHCTKYCVEQREAFDCEYSTLNTLRTIKNAKFNQFLSILHDIKWICE